MFRCVFTLRALFYKSKAGYDMLEEKIIDPKPYFLEPVSELYHISGVRTSVIWPLEK